MLFRLSLILFLVITSCSKPKTKDIVFDDFENVNFNKWNIQGTAFNRPVEVDSLIEPILNAHGKFVAFSNFSIQGKSWNQGKLVSKEFTINRKYINFLIAGGNHDTRECVNLIINNKVVRVATGKNDNLLRAVIWDVSSYVGEKAVIEVIDAMATSYERNAKGHIIVDHIVFSDNILKREVVFEDFENGTYNNWEIEGNAFVVPRSRTNVYYPITAQGFGGNYFAFSFGDTHDVEQGKLTSKLFIIKHNYIKFLIGGGNHKERTCVNLVVNDSVVLSAQGKNDGLMRWVIWDVSNFNNQVAEIEIVDSYSGGWGHIMVDDLIFFDNPPFYETIIFWTIIVMVLIISIVIRKISSSQKKVIPKVILNTEELKKLENLIRESKVFTQPNASTEEVVKISGYTKTEILYLFEKEGVNSLSTYLNFLRVEEFKEQLKDPSNKAFTLIAIAKKCGFSSKTSFYRIFKSITNTTPSEYKKSNS